MNLADLLSWRVRRRQRTMDRYSAAARALVERLPAELRQALGQLTIVVQWEPDNVAAGVPPEAGLENPAAGVPPGALALFRGVQLADPDDYPSGRPRGPSVIVIFAGNVEKRGVGELEITLLHELGHFFGLGEAEVSELGLK